LTSCSLGSNLYIFGKVIDNYYHVLNFFPWPKKWPTISISCVVEGHGMAMTWSFAWEGLWRWPNFLYFWYVQWKFMHFFKDKTVTETKSFKMNSISNTVMNPNDTILMNFKSKQCLNTFILYWKKKWTNNICIPCYRRSWCNYDMKFSIRRFMEITKFLTFLVCQIKIHAFFKDKM